MHLTGWFFVALLVGLVVGWGAKQFLRKPGYGVLLDVGIAVVGALLGGGLARLSGFPGGDSPVLSITAGVAGAVALTALIRSLVRVAREDADRGD